MKIRKANLEDLELVMSFIEMTKEDFKANGIDQWQNGYPNDDSIKDDISIRRAYVCTLDDQVVAYFYFSNETDPFYNEISQGQWLNDNPYFVIHRFVVDPKMRGKGIAKWIMEQCSNMIIKFNVDDIRVDTHPDNSGMLSLLKSCSYQYCGKVTVNDGLRLAFQYTSERENV